MGIIYTPFPLLSIVTNNSKSNTSTPSTFINISLLIQEYNHHVGLQNKSAGPAIKLLELAGRFWLYEMHLLLALDMTPALRGRNIFWKKTH